eukprot:Phypoly_transcript_15162.p1 GENE.Phypoly_transcript_15162~~Phypoly_transcript_15162.p1  ORF type:complete len:204 (+),score=9.16 Phypoly_transcript_15162:100-711(+)
MQGLVALRKQQNFMWCSHLSGVPLKLLIICILQLVIHFLGIFLGIGKVSCPLLVHSGNDVEVNCTACVKHHFLTWQQVTLFILGFAIILIGIGAAVFRNKTMCKLYGLILLVYSFVLGITSLLTGLDTVVLEDAAKGIDGVNVTCISMVKSMVSTSKVTAVLFGINCVLDIIGAIYAIKSKELFEFQEIDDHHNSFHKSYAPL